jgi:hypothetical protein
MPANRRHSGGILPAFCLQNDVLPAFCRQSAGLDRQKFQLFEVQTSSHCPRGTPSYPLKQFKLWAANSAGELRRPHLLMMFTFSLQIVLNDN